MTRLTALVQSHPRLVEAAVLAVAIAVLLVSVLPNLGNHPAVTDDEVWVLSGAYKLATEGVFGSDMFQGFYSADSHYFFNMPGQHFVLAGAMKVLGYGIFQARLVGVLYGVATLLLTYLLAKRAHGLGAAVMSLVLLLFLRLNMGFDTGLPLQELSSSIRYDLAPVPFMLAGVLVLLNGPSLLRSLLAGALFGLAILLQFYGAFIFPIAIVFLWTEALPRAQRFKLIGALVGASFLVCLPYGVYALAHYDDFKGQAGTVDQRDDFYKPSFYIDNLIDERHRFTNALGFRDIPRGADPFVVSPRYLSLTETLPRRPSAKVGVIVGVPLALGYLGLRAFRDKRRADRLLFLCLAGLIVKYALFESAKFYYYWIPVVPFLCIGIAAAVIHLLRAEMWRHPRGRLVAGATALVLLAVLAEGSVARLNGLRVSREAGNYNRLAAAVHEHVPPGSRVVGSTSSWWGMRDTDFRSYFLFFYLTRDDAGPYRKTLSGFLSEFQPQYLVLTRVAGHELERRLAPQERAEWQAYLRDHATKLQRIEVPLARGYGYVDIWKLQ